jgi:hypothetical protein
MYRNATFYFFGVLLLAIAGFLPTYFTQLSHATPSRHIRMR